MRTSLPSNTVRAAALANFASVARQVGLDPLAALRRFGLDPRVLNEPDLRVSPAAIAELLEYAADAARCPTFGLQMAETRRLSNLGPVSFLLTNQRTLRDALDTLARYRNLLHEALSIRMEDFGDTVFVRTDLFVDGARELHQAHELVVGSVYRLCCALLGPRWRPISVHFTHKAPADLAVHRRVFAADCVFGSELNGLLCSAADLDRANPAADPALVPYAERFMSVLPQTGQAAIASEVRQAIQILLPSHRATITRVASSLGLNVRTLQRRLDDEGVGFVDLLHQVRRELADRYVAGNAYPLTHVAAMLGYAQLSSFTRWFSAEFGTAPTKWRELSAK